MKLLFIYSVASVLRCGVWAQVPETTPIPPTLTSFSCHGRRPGYYADLETGCKTYHVCDGHSQFTYVCPKRTLFQQRSRICNHSYLVRCEDSQSFYEEEDIQEQSDVFIRLAGTEKSRISIKENDVFNQTNEFATPNNEPKEIQTTEPPPSPTPTTTVKSTTFVESTTLKPKDDDDAIKKFVKFRLKDFRSLFFIPEFENNSIVAKSEKELILPVEKNDVMTFRNQKNGPRLFNLCPAYCNPKFFVPGTCHPCIMIK